MFDLKQFQAEQLVWSARNFGHQPPHRQLLGIQEEVGELSHAHLKMEQGIRGSSFEHHRAKADAVGDIMVYLAGYCNDNQLDLETCVRTAWEEVKRRDWVKNDVTGKVS